MKLKYYINRIKSIEFKRMNEILNREAKRYNKSKLSVKLDFLSCALKYIMGYEVDIISHINEEEHKKLHCNRSN